MANRTPLYGWHRAAGAQMIEFAGWEMPLQYAGIVEEHRTVRRAVGVFDVSHMGKIVVEGRGAGRFLDGMSAAAIPDGPGRARYTHLLREDATILDDVIVTCTATDRYLVVCNGGPRSAVMQSLLARRPPDLAIEDRTHDVACIAVQGPRCPDVLRRLVSEDVAGLPLFHAAFTGFEESSDAHRSGPPEMEGWGSDEQDHLPFDVSVLGRVLITRTGYTGEAGFELFASAQATLSVWERLLAAGSDLGVRPIGLGARDTLRLEKGYLLSGQDFDGRQTPLEVGCGWLVAWDHEFLGRSVLLAQRARGDYRRLVGLRMDDRAIPRHGQAVLARGSAVGVVTSGTLSPSLRVGIALASVDPGWGGVGTALEVDVRGVPHPAHVVRLPFL